MYQNVRTFYITSRKNKATFQDDKPKIHHLIIEVHREILEIGGSGNPCMLYHLQDSNVPVELSGNHIVIKTKNESEVFGNMYSIDTEPIQLENNFGLIVKFCPRIIADSISQIESFLPLRIEKPVFSRRNGWEINYYGLINDLYKKGLKG